MSGTETGGVSAPPGFTQTQVVTVQNKDQIPEMLASVEINCRRGLPFLQIEPERAGSFIIVGGGPSLADCLERLQALDTPNNRIVAMNDAACYLIDHGIKPYAAVAWETSTAARCRLTKERPDIKYLLASRAHPDWFAYLHGRERILWHSYDDVGEREVIEKYDPDPVMIAGGTSHGLRSIEIGRAMGFRSFHLFGFDGSYGEKSHAYYHRQQPAEHFEAWVGGQVFKTCHHWAQHAVDLVNQVRAYEAQEAKYGTPFRLVVHGAGLIPAYAKANGLMVMEA